MSLLNWDWEYFKVCLLWMRQIVWIEFRQLGQVIGGVIYNMGDIIFIENVDIYIEMGDV